MHSGGWRMPRTPPDTSAKRPLVGTLADLRRLHKQRRKQRVGSATSQRASDHTLSDRKLFLQAMQQVTPLAPSKAAHRHTATPMPAAAPEALIKRRAHAVGDANLLVSESELSDAYHPLTIQHHDASFVRPGQDPSLARQLRRGKRPVDASIDLHGLDLNRAREQRDRFIHTGLEKRWRCIQIVHGKGYGSRHQPILKQAVRRWLTQYHAVLAYSECRE